MAKDTSSNHAVQANKSFADARKHQLSESIVVDSEENTDVDMEEAVSVNGNSFEEVRSLYDTKNSTTIRTKHDESNRVSVRTEIPDSSSEAPSSSSDGEDPGARKRKLRDTSTDGSARLVNDATQAMKRTHYVPPAGYSKVKQARSRNCLDSSALKGKEIWHIICPQTLPVASLQTATFMDVASGKESITHEGNEYDQLEEEASIFKDGNANLSLLLDNGGCTYKPAYGSLARIIHIRQKLVSTASSNALRGQSLGACNFREQPRGLRMRYRPPGSGSGIGSGTEIHKASGAVGMDDLESSKVEVDGAKAVSARLREPVTKIGAVTPLSKSASRISVGLEGIQATNSVSETSHSMMGSEQSDDEDAIRVDTITPTSKEKKLPRDGKAAKLQRKEQRQLKRMLKEEKRMAKEKKRSSKADGAG